MRKSLTNQRRVSNMPIILSLLSGKGGCGKTTIALALSKMLSDCGIKVVLVDCDIATNGATYFFESRLIDKYSILTLFNLINSDVAQLENKSLFKVSDNFSFIPSNVEFPNKNHIDYKNLSLSFIRNLSERFCEVIILDCQAGYSDLLREVIEISNINLMVLEPDAISSSAMRVLYAQLSDKIEKNKTYQIFNKITKDEYEIYNKIFAGTFFDALPPIMFNWEVRKSFAFAQVPEMVTTNIEFGNNVYQLAKILFPSLETRLHQYTRKILSLERENLQIKVKKIENQTCEELEKTLNGKWSERRFSIMSDRSNIILAIISISLFVMFVAKLVREKVQNVIINQTTVSVMIGLSFVAVGALITLVISRINSKKKMAKLDKRTILRKSELQISMLEKRISEINSQIEPEFVGDHENKN